MIEAVTSMKSSGDNIAESRPYHATMPTPTAKPYPISSYGDLTEAALLEISRNLTQTALWLYSKKLVGLFSISPAGVVTWTSCYSPDSSATAPLPASGGWADDFAGQLVGGPASWWRAINPLTGAISAAYDTPVCYV